jgi:hypothetical protein
LTWRLVAFGALRALAVLVVFFVGFIKLLVKCTSRGRTLAVLGVYKVF